MKELKDLVREHIWKLTPYSSARDEYSGHVAHVFIDANENPYNKLYNRYPDPLQKELKKKIARIKGVAENSIFLGNGSDEAIDLVYRCFCTPMKDNVVAIEPTYGMYKVCADINNVEYRKVLLDSNFNMNARELLAACDENTKVIWICTPNNPSGNDISRNEIEYVIENFQGVVVVDEAYSDFSRQKAFRTEITKYPNLIVLNTMSKAWGCAGIRLGMAFADADIIDIFNKVKYPYNVNCLTQEKAGMILDNIQDVQMWVSQILGERQRVMEAFVQLDICVKLYPTSANFFLVEVTDAQAIYDYLVSKGIIVRNRTQVALCKNCLRITIGNRSENNELISALRIYKA